MAYLLKDTDEARAARKRRENEHSDEDRSSSLFRSVFTALHGVGKPLSAASASAHGPNTAPQSSLHSSARPDSGTGGNAVLAASSHHHRNGPPASAAFARQPQSALVPSRRNSSSSSSTDTSDTELYRKAVDFADVVSIISAPTQPPSRQGFAKTPSATDDVRLIAPSLLSYFAEQSNQSGHHRTSEVRDKPAACRATQLRSENSLRFTRIAEDTTTGVEVFSAPVEDFPIHLMRATAIMPCGPSELLQYMDNNVRPQWDTYIKESRIIRELPRWLDTSLDDGEGKGDGVLSAQLRVRQDGLGFRAGGGRGEAGEAASGTGGAHSNASQTDMQTPPFKTSSLTLPPSLFSYKTPFAFLPGQRRVALHYLGVKSPVFLVQDRDFELVVSESVLPDGTAIMKAFSAPRGAGMPLDPAQSRYVRAVVVLSGIVARPLRIPTNAAKRATAERLVQALPPSLRAVAAAELAACDAQRADLLKRRLRNADGEKGGDATPAVKEELLYCLFEYFGLVHPLGLMLPQIVNIVISAQTSTLKKLQAFVATHPLESLRPLPLPVPAWQQEREAARRRDQEGDNEGDNTADERTNTARQRKDKLDGRPSTPDTKVSAKQEKKKAAAGGEEDPWWKRAKGKLLSKL